MLQETNKEKAARLLRNTIAGNEELQKHFDNLMAQANPPTPEQIIAFCEQMCFGEDLLDLFNLTYTANTKGQNRRHGYTFRTFFMDVIKVTKMTTERSKKRGSYRKKRI
jgi:hypothetical protein